MNIINNPEYIPENIYSNAIQEYIHKIKHIKGVLSIATMGSVSAPGLSDIDIIVVVSDDYNKENSKILDSKGIDDRLFIHGPIIIPKKMVKSFQYIIYATNIKIVHGEDIFFPSFKDLDVDHKEVLSSCYLIDFIESRFLQYALVEATDEIDKRAWLARVWSVLHSVSIFTNSYKKELPLSMLNHVNSIKSTRANWKIEKNISDHLFTQAFKASIELNNYIFHFVLQEIYSCASHKKNYTYFDVQKKINFSHDQVKYIARRWKVFNRQLTVFECNQLPCYAIHLSQYNEDLFKKGLVSKNTSKNTLRSRVMKERYRLVSNHKKWLQHHAPQANSMSGYVGFSSTNYSLRDSILRMATRVLG